jgi:hypothetical protein
MKFFPKMAQVTKKKGLKQIALKPLFPNYLFIHLDKQVANFNAIRSTRGVGSFVRFGLNQAIINSDIIGGSKTNIAGDKQGKTLAELFALLPRLHSGAHSGLIKRPKSDISCQRWLRAQHTHDQNFRPTKSSCCKKPRL